MGEGNPGRGAGASGGRLHSIDDAAWIAADADIVAFLTRSPGECLRKPEEDDRYLVEIGRAAFRTPMLLGGVAARGGLSCNSCHRDGRSNPDFFMTDLSGAPGTADVTSSLFSKSRDDGVLNPVPIPDLVGAGTKTSFGSHGAKTLDEFISGAIVEEFDGAAPPASIVAGLVAYVGHLDAAACPTKPGKTTVKSAMSDVSRALRAADAAIARGDPAADLMLVAAQSGLGRVHQRFDSLAEERQAIEDLSRDIGALRALAGDAPQAARPGVRKAIDEVKELRRRLHAARERSLYDERAIKTGAASVP